MALQGVEPLNESYTIPRKIHPPAHSPERHYFVLSCSAPLHRSAQLLQAGQSDYLFFPGIRKAVEEKADTVEAYRVHVEEGTLQPFTLTLGELTDEERQIILKGCLLCTAS